MIDQLIEGWLKIEKAKREVEAQIEYWRREKAARKDLYRHVRLSPTFYLNSELKRGVFEDKYYHFIQINLNFRGTGDYGLNLIFASVLFSAIF